MATSGLDPEIDPVDSWAMADLAVDGTVEATSTETMLDPYTGTETTNLAAPTDLGDVNFQTGYTPTGAVVAVTKHTPEPDDPDSTAVAVTKIVGGVATDYDSLGRVVLETPVDTLDGQSPLTDLPVLSGSTLFDAIVAPEDYEKPPEDGGGGGDGCQDCEIGPQPRGSLMGGALVAGADRHRRVLRRTATELVEETDLDDADQESVEPGRGVRRHGRVMRGFARRGGRWVLDSLVLEQRYEVDGRVTRHRHRLRVKRVRFHLNDARDRARRQQAATAAEAAAMRGATNVRMRAIASSRPALPSVMLASRKAMQPGTSTPQLNTTCDQITSSFGGGPSLVLQHGFMSDACTWARMDPWLSQEFRFASKVKISTNAFASYDVQARELRATMIGSGGRDYVMIGHSNGGIISRRVAQVGDAGLVRGVLTVHSPHGGVPALNKPIRPIRELVLIVTAPFKAALCVVRKRGCGEIEAIRNTEGTIEQLHLMERDNLGVLGQMPTDAPFRATLNAPVETFVHASIVGHSYKRWLWKRMYADQRCAEPESPCGGKEAVKRTARYYKHLKKSVILNSLMPLGNVAQFNLGGFVSYGVRAVKDATILSVLWLTDYSYRRWIAGGDDSDGIVPGWSQVWPKTSPEQQFHVPDADSHVGATKSEKTLIRIRRALRSPVLFAM